MKTVDDTRAAIDAKARHCLKIAISAPVRGPRRNEYCRNSYIWYGKTKMV